MPLKDWSLITGRGGGLQNGRGGGYKTGGGGGGHVKLYPYENGPC